MGKFAKTLADIGQFEPVQPPGTSGLMTILGYMLWGVGFIGVIGVMVCSIMMIMAHRKGEAPEAASKLGWIFGACIVATAAPLLVNTFV